MGEGGTTARCWDLATDRPIGCAVGSGKCVEAAAFSPDSRTIITGCDDKMQLWEATTGRPLGSPLQIEARLGFVSFSPDSTILLTGGGGDGKVRIWDAATGRPLGPPLDCEGYLTALAFRPDGKTFLTGSYLPSDADSSSSDRHLIQQWTTATGRPLGLPLIDEERVAAVAFSPDGNDRPHFERHASRRGSGTSPPASRSASPPSNHGRSWRWRSAPTARQCSPGARTGRRGSGTPPPAGPSVLPLHRSKVRAVAFSPDGKTVHDRERRRRRLGSGTHHATVGPPLRHRPRSRGGVQPRRQDHDHGELGRYDTDTLAAADDSPTTWNASPTGSRPSPA